MTGRIVYTALFGGYERLRPQPVAAASGTTFYCFTDDPGLTSDDWTVVPVEPLFSHDSVRSARAIKTVGHPLLDAADETLWIDNRVELTASPDAVLDAWLANHDAAFVEHSFRDTLMDEFTAVADAGMDDTTRVWEHLLHTLESDAEVLDRRPLWTGIIARRRTPATAEFGRRWHALVNRYSRRDQLSVLQALASSGLEARRLELDNRASEWHRWPEVDATLRRRPAYHERWQNAMRAPAATAAALRDRNLRLERRVQELEDRQQELDDERRAHDAAAEASAESLRAVRSELTRSAEQLANEQRAGAAAQDRIAELEAEVGARRRAADRLRDDLRRVSHELDGITASGSYRLAARIARLRPRRVSEPAHDGAAEDRHDA